MGTPGKWIKKLLGKKSSKSNLSKKKDIFKPLENKDVLVSSEVSVSNPIVDCSPITPPTFGANAAEPVLSENGVVGGSSNERVILTAGDEEPNTLAVVKLGSQVDLEKIKLTEAAIKTQAAFRGYVARRSFRTLKGIIRLQAVIRGHLVRRQAIATLHCVRGIVKFQALVRGYKVRHSDVGCAVQKVCKDTKCSSSIGVATSTQAKKLPNSIFVQKLLASSSSAVPLYCNYDPGEPNLAREWLDRWTRSHLLAPLPESTKKIKLASDEKNGSHLTIESDEAKVKRNAWKVSGVKVENGSMSESNKHKRHVKKVSSHPLNSGQEQSQKEIEKNNLKKTHVQNVSDRSQLSNEKRKHITKKVSGHTVTDVAERGPGTSARKIKDLSVSKSKQSDPEKCIGQQAEYEHDNELHDNTIAELQTNMKNGKDEGIQRFSEDLNGGDNSTSNMNPKYGQRRASLPANFDDQENGVHNTPSPRLPSYMAPTESAKARLRGQGSPRFASDLIDKSSIARRHSLSSSLNGKLDSFSPRAERLVSTSSRGVIRTDRSLTSSRDGSVSDRLIQPKWRR